MFLNPIPHAGGGGGRGAYMTPPATFQQFSLEVLIRGGPNYTLHLSFAIAEHLKLVSGQKIFLWRVGGLQSQEGSSFFAPFLSRN